MNILDLYSLIIFVFAIIIVCLIFWKAEIWQGNRKTDYRSLFILGMIFIPAGIFLLLIGNAGYGLIGLGSVWAVAGYINKDKWTKKS